MLRIVRAERFLTSTQMSRLFPIARGIASYGELGFEREGVQRKAYKRAAEPGSVDEIMMVKFAGPLACPGAALAP